MCYQFVVNGARLGTYQMIVQKGWTKRSDGTISSGKTLFFALVCGAFGGAICSPFFLVKTHLQSKANEISIAVGHQHKHEGMLKALQSIYKAHGVRGLWRGTTSNVPRLCAASAGQLLSFEKIHEYMKRQFPDRTYLPLCLSSFGAGFFMALAMAPFDLIATRFYNQGTDAKGKGLFYRSVVDCTVKIYQKEGLLAFYKGLTACYFRLGPYTMLVLVIWDRMKHFHNLHKGKKLGIVNG